MCIMEISTIDLSVQIKEVYDDKKVKEIIYGDDFTLEKKYYLKINNVFYMLEYIDIKKLQFIIFEKYCILINERKIYILNEEIYYFIEVESFYLGHLFFDKKLFIIFQTEILSINDKMKLNRKYTNFINDFSVKSNGILNLNFDDSIMTFNLNDDEI